MYLKRNVFFMGMLSLLSYLTCFSNFSCNKTTSFNNGTSPDKTVFTSLAELRNMQVEPNTTYHTSDNGGANWLYDLSDNSSPDNSGTVISTVRGRRLKRKFDGAINLKWFGAKGDGITDDTEIFNLALAAAQTQKKDLYIPAGTYSCNKKDRYNHILFLNAGGMNNITIYGDGDSSKITTAVKNISVLLYVSAYSKCTNLTFKKLFFESTHDTTKEINQGIFLQGTRGQNFNNTIVKGCRFEGFSTALLGQGLAGIEISNNVFNAPKGHDNAQTNTNPAVFIWLFDNSNGFCQDISIINNNANGYSGKVAVNTLATKRAMDGFIYGTGYGYMISGNKCKNFSEEHIAIAPQANPQNPDNKITITLNELNGDIPTGSLDQDGKTVHAGNYGIRCDAGNATITQNTISHFSTGIMVRTYNNPAVTENMFTISGNTLSSGENEADVLVKAGISVQGNPLKKLRNVIISNNNISVSDAKSGNFFNGIMLYDTDTAQVENNTIAINNLVSQNAAFNCGISYGRVTMVTDKSNTITGITPYRTSSPEQNKIIFIKQ